LTHYLAFEPDDSANVFKPLVLGKKMFIIEARGDSGFQPGGQYEKMNYHDPYLVTVFGFIGITDITFIHVETEEYGGQNLAESIANARAKITELVAV
jgi:FMN-dependent NADH-azoreductase